MVKIDGLDHVALTVTDVSRSVAWYRDTLGLERYYEEAWGDQPAVVGDTLTLRHVAFRTDRASWEELRERFRRDAVPYQFEDHGISHSLYLHDPDGHRLEITTYDV